MEDHSYSPADGPAFADPVALHHDPHAGLAALRRDHHVVKLADWRYLVLRADDVIRLMTDPRVTPVEGKDYVELHGIPDGAAARFLSDFFLFASGAEHRDRRGLFARSFSHVAMRNARPGIRKVADEIVADLPRDESFDFVDTMASQVPARMIAEILGLPVRDVPLFRKLVYTLAQSLVPVYPIEAHGRIEDAARDLYDYVERQIRVRLTLPGEDLLSRVAEDWKATQTIPFESLVHQVLGLIIGGTDTTRGAFASLVSLLLQHPDQWAALQRDPSLIPGAVAEALRFDPSVGSTVRMTTDTLWIGDTPVPPHSMLSLSTMSAMRDPALYDDPDRFDIRRTGHPRLHTVFGNGPHRCLGEMLARIEMEEGLAALLSAAPEITLETAPRLVGFGGIRHVTPMQVRIAKPRATARRAG